MSEKNDPHLLTLGYVLLKVLVFKIKERILWTAGQKYQGDKNIWLCQLHSKIKEQMTMVQ